MTERQPSGWRVQHKPMLMTRHYEFANYAETRLFLDHLAQLSERTGYFPDMNFAKTYVNLSMTPQEEILGPSEYSFAEQVDTLALLATRQTTG